MSASRRQADGNVLVQASPGTFSTPSHFWEFKYAKRTAKWKATQVNDTTHASNTSSFESNLMPLPTGEVLWDQSQSGTEVAVYKPLGSPKATWLPVVSSVSSSLTRGSTGNAISGTNFNGFDLGGVYGDDAQSATNFPLVRITNNGTGDTINGQWWDRLLLSGDNVLGNGDFESALTEVENLYLNELMKTEDATEGVQSFMEKRKPEWRNR